MSLFIPTLRSLALAALVALPLSAGAAGPAKRMQLPENYCRPGEEILGATHGCSDNRVFVDEADACLDRLRAQVDKAVADMKLSFSDNATGQQTAKFSSADQDYKAASATLSDLLRLTDQVMDEVDAYSDDVNLPEDTFNDELTGGDEEGYAEMHPCYSETRDSIDEILDDLDDVKADLTDAKTAADAAAAISTGRRTGLDVQAGSGAAAPITGGHAQGSGAKVPAGKSKNGASDITGVQQDQQKANSK